MTLRLLFAALGVWWSSVAFAADRADSIRPLPEEEETVTRGQAEFGAGLMTLPGAEVCIDRRLGCTSGDASIIVSGWPMFRRGRFAVGAGVMLGLTSSSDAPRNETPDIPRDHWRRYFSVEVAGRYYVPLTPTLEGWVGVTTGLGVVSDTFQSQRGLSEQALVGPRGLIIITEGATLGVGVGLQHSLSENWLVGANLRLSEWFLPATPARDVLGDEASLKGVVTTLDLGVSLAYRSRLVF
jgi:hypothetical protein